MTEFNLFHAPRACFVLCKNFTIKEGKKAQFSHSHSSTMAPAFTAISPVRSVGLFYPRLNRDAISSHGFAASFFDLSRYERGTGLPTKQDIRQKVTTVLCASPKINYKSFTVKADLRREFKLDNLDLKDIALELEKLFSIKVSQRDIEESFDTGLDIIDFVCHCLGVL